MTCFNILFYSWHLILSIFAFRYDGPALQTNQRPQQITHFNTITPTPHPCSLPEHGWVQVSPVCLPLCANFSSIICCNKCVMGRVTFTLIVCTQRGSLPPHHVSKVFSIVSNFLFPFLTPVYFFLHSQYRPNDSICAEFHIGHCCEK